MRDNRIYRRQAELRPNIDIETIIVGTGGVGAWVAIFLALAGVEKIHLFDHDNIEHHNLNRLPFVIDSAVGQKKVEVTGNFLHQLRPDIEVKKYPFKFEELFLPETADILFCCADNPEVEKETYKLCSKYNIRWVRLACSQDHITITGKQSKWTGGNEDGGYEGVPTWIVPAVLSAILGAYAILTDTRVDFVGGIGKMLKRPSGKKSNYYPKNEDDNIDTEGDEGGNIGLDGLEDINNE